MLLLEFLKIFWSRILQLVDNYVYCTLYIIHLCKKKKATLWRDSMSRILRTLVGELISLVYRLLLTVGSLSCHLSTEKASKNFSEIRKWYKILIFLITSFIDTVANYKQLTPSRLLCFIMTRKEGMNSCGEVIRNLFSKMKCFCKSTSSLGFYQITSTTLSWFKDLPLIVLFSFPVYQRIDFKMFFFLLS